MHSAIQGLFQEKLSSFWSLLGFFSVIVLLAQVFSLVLWQGYAQYLWPLLVVVCVLPFLWKEFGTVAPSLAKRVIRPKDVFGICKVAGAAILALYLVSSLLVWLAPIDMTSPLFEKGMDKVMNEPISGGWGEFSFFVSNNMKVLGKTFFFAFAFGTAGMVAVAYTLPFGASLTGLIARTNWIESGFGLGAASFFSVIASIMLHSIFEFGAFILVGTAASLVTYSWIHSVPFTKYLFVNFGILILCGILGIFLGALLEAYLAQWIFYGLQNLLGFTSIVPTDFFSLSLF